MKRTSFLFCVLLAIGSTLSAEAVVLSAGTILIAPDALRTTLDEPMFLLSRSDMEAAALAMETLPIREEQIKNLETSIGSLTVLVITVPILTALIAYLVGTAVPR